MTKEIYKKLRDDEHYYGDYGKQFLSNSDISTLLKNPKDLHKPKPSSPAFLVGGYFHTAILNIAINHNHGSPLSSDIGIELIIPS